MLIPTTISSTLTWPSPSQSPQQGPGVLWPASGGALILAAWLLLLLARKLNAGGTFATSAALGMSVVTAAAGAGALLMGPWRTGLDPAAHVYPAIVWLLAIWTAMHVAVGIVMLLYLLARRWAGRLTRTHDIDLHNVTLYWHFTMLTAAVTVLVVAGFPLVAR
jgi:cytochrome c oxidase subunit I+III